MGISTCSINIELLNIQYTTRNIQPKKERKIEIERILTWTLGVFLLVIDYSDFYTNFAVFCLNPQCAFKFFMWV